MAGLALRSRFGAAEDLTPSDTLAPLVWPERVFSLTRQPSTPESAGIQSGITSFMRTLHELDTLSALGISGSEYANKWGELLRWQIELRRIAGPQINGTATALVEELGRRVADREARRSAPLSGDSLRVDRLLSRLSTLSPEEWARSRRQFMPAEVPPAEALPELLAQLEAMEAEDAADLAEQARLEGELTAATARRDALAQDLAAAQQNAHEGQVRLGSVVSQVADAVLGEAGRAITTVAGWRDEVATTFLPAEVRSWGRAVDAEVRRAGRTFDRQLRRSVEDVAVRYGPWLRIAAAIAMPLTLYGMAAGLTLTVVVVSSEVSYTYHQRQTARRAMAEHLAALREELARVNQEADALLAALEQARSALALAISQRADLAAALERETAADIAEIEARGRRTLLYGAGILGLGILGVVVVRAARARG